MKKWIRSCCYMPKMPPRRSLPSSSSLQTQMLPSWHGISAARYKHSFLSWRQKECLLWNFRHSGCSRTYCNALVGLQAFTGCDSTSALAGRGTKNQLKLCQIDSAAFQTMQSLGLLFDERIPFTSCEAFVCKMHGKPKISSYWMPLCNILSKAEPVPQSSTISRCLCEITQCEPIWRNAPVANPKFPSPFQHGWLITDDSIEIDSMSLPPALEVLLQLILCVLMYEELYNWTLHRQKKWHVMLWFLSVWRCM